MPQQACCRLHGSLERTLHQLLLLPRGLLSAGMPGSKAPGQSVGSLQHPGCHTPLPSESPNPKKQSEVIEEEQTVQGQLVPGQRRCGPLAAQVRRAGHPP